MEFPDLSPIQHVDLSDESDDIRSVDSDQSLKDDIFEYESDDIFDNMQLKTNRLKKQLAKGRKPDHLRFTYGPLGGLGETRPKRSKSLDGPLGPDKEPINLPEDYFTKLATTEATNKRKEKRDLKKRLWEERFAIRQREDNPNYDGHLAANENRLQKMQDVRDKRTQGTLATVARKPKRARPDNIGAQPNINNNNNDTQWEEIPSYAYQTTRKRIRRGPETRAKYGFSWKMADQNQRENRLADNFTGKGKYRRRKRKRRRRSYKKYKRGRGAYWGKAIGAGIGSLFGNPAAGAQIGDKGSDAAEWLYKAFKKKHKGRGMYTGNGEYVAANDLAPGTGTTFSVPQFAPSTDGATIVVSHKEYIGDIYGPPPGVNFKTQVYKINPGIEKTFPYLSQLAANYDEYQLHQCIFTYKSTVADFASQSGQVGQIVTATQYNNANEPFSDKRSMMEYDASMSCKSSEHLVSGVECDPTKLSGAPGKYTRVGPIKQGGDINQYDHAQFNIAVHDCPDTYDNQVLGELWISYTVELRKPKFFTAKGFSQQTAIFGSDLGTASEPFKNLAAGEQNSFGINIDTQSSIADWYLNNGTGSKDLKSLDHRASILRPTDQRVDAQTTTLTFPGNYTGNIQLTYVIRGDQKAGNMHNSDDPEFDDLRVTGSGNISRVEDIVTSDGKWSNAYVAVQSDTNRDIKMITVHLRIEQATDGLDNVIFLYNDPGSGGLMNIGVTSYLRIEEYNTIGNYKQDGTKDDVRMVDTTGTLIPYPSQTV